MKVGVKCGNCGSANMNIRSSRVLSQTAVESKAICLNCFAVSTYQTGLLKLKTPEFKTRPEALTATKPLQDIDPNQNDFDFID